MLGLHQLPLHHLSSPQGAEEEARRLDSLPREERGPLHGVPVSIKVCAALTTRSSSNPVRFTHSSSCYASLTSPQECYDVLGTYSTAGCAVYARAQVITHKYVSHSKSYLNKVNDRILSVTDCSTFYLNPFESPKVQLSNVFPGTR